MKVHKLADVQSSHIGPDTTVWQFSIILKGAVIGNSCNINCHTFIENDVVIGDRVTIKSGVYLWDGLQIENDVFIGPNVTFTNDKYPRSKQYPDSFQKTKLNQGCSIGANATILGGISIGEYAIVGAGSVVTKTVPPFALVRGNPAKIVAWVDKKGTKLKEQPIGRFSDDDGHEFIIKEGNLVKI
jgi:UDP-2-acetamido-3-amino-2,3-dideoxy-glucuronate N-acetyltransferase